jgi:hypothetical protein
LDEQPTQVPQAELASECEAIVVLWQSVFGGGADQ